MTAKQIACLKNKRARYAALLGDEVAAIVEADTGVMTARMSERERLVAQRYREAVQQLAGC